MATASKPKPTEAVEAVEAVPLVTNNHAGMLNIGGVDIAPGGVATIDSWDTVKDTAVIVAWLSNGVIEAANGAS